MNNLIINIFLTLYQVKIEYCESYNGKIIYLGADENEALIEFESVDSSDSDYDNVDAICIFSKKVNTYNWIGDEDYDINDYPIEDYYDDNDCYELVEDSDEWEEIDNKDLDNLSKLKEIEEMDNYSTLDTNIENYIKSISKEYKYAAFLNSTFYALIPYKDGFIQVRIADHFFNPSNIHLGRNVQWDYLENAINEKRNIYGFLSIHLLNSNTDYYKDKRGYRSDFKYAKSEAKYSDLITYITYDISKTDIDDIDYETDIDDYLEAIRDEIDIVYEEGLYDIKDDDGDYIELKY